jgi:hypothetical protein
MRLSASRRLTLIPLTGVWYRAIRIEHWESRLSTAHTRTLASRFSPGTKSACQFELLHLAQNDLAAKFEVGALLGIPDEVIANPKHTWVTLPLDVRLQKVADLTTRSQLALLNTTAQELTGKWSDYEQSELAPTQALGIALFEAPDIEGLRTLSAKAPYHNLVVFPQKLLPGSQIEYFNPTTKKREYIKPGRKKRGR